MDSIERFYATVAGEATDRPAAWLGLPNVNAQKALCEYFGVKDIHGLKVAVGDDIYAFGLPYKSEISNAIWAAFDWYLDGKVEAQDRTLTADGCFKNCRTPEDLAFFNWPDPEKHISPDECRRAAETVPAGKTALGVVWSGHFQDTCAAFGMETALVNMLENPELYQAVDEKIVKFYLRANEIFLEATKGKIHTILIGNDMGCQRGLMLSPELIRRFVMPGAKELVEQAHSYGVKVIYHSCGSIDAVIPDLIEAGVDVIHPIQAKAAGMDARSLKERFGSKVAFCGGVDTQDLLVNGTPDEVTAKVRELREIFPTGLIISPSHEAILPDIPPKNIAALFEEATNRRT